MMLAVSIYIAQANNGSAGGVLALIPLVIALVIGVAVVAGMWRVFTKAGQPGWGCLIPVLNVYYLMLVAGRPGWWLILLFIPVVNFVVMVIVCMDVAKNFGKGVGFAVGLLLLGFIFYPILGFSDAQYSPVSH